MALKAAGLALAAFLLSSPFLLWRRTPSRELGVLIIDKTVPDITRREHAGLAWLLKHRKIRKPGGEDFSREDDYYGFVPLPGRKWLAREPSITKASPELIYLADAYGVYTEEFHGNALGDRSRLIHGGLRMDEVRDLQAALPGCLTLVGEFNTFADPTEASVRNACGDLFGLDWRGWIMRFFSDLDRRGEMPPWAVRNWERQTGRSWAFKGPGFLLMNRDDRVEILKEGTDVEPRRGLRFQGLPAGAAGYGLPHDARYDYWFDLVTPRPGTEVLAEYELPVLPEGERKLKALGLGRRYPAILASRKGNTRIFYFAGDFADAWPVPTMHRIAGYAAFHQLIDREVPGEGQSFFWRVYVPLMTHVLDDAWARKTAR